MNAFAHADHLSPTRTGDPYWNESAWFSFSIPEREIHGFIYYFFRPNMNMLVGGPAIWDRTGSLSADCLFYDWPYFQAIPQGADKYNFTAPNSLHVELLEPLKRYRLRYDKDGCKIDLDWTGFIEANDYLNMEQAATGAASSNRMHLEQCGRARGTLELNGEVLKIDCFSLRDASHGVRSYAKVAKGSYFWAIKSESDAFHTMTIGDGLVQPLTGGFLMRDGKIAPLASGERRVTKDGRLGPHEFDLTAKDTLGRTLDVHGYLSSTLLFPGYPEIGISWSLLKVDYEGTTGWGDVQEFEPKEMFRRRLRARRAE